MVGRLFRGNPRNPQLRQAKNEPLIVLHLNQTLDDLYCRTGVDKQIVRRLFSQLGAYDHKGGLVRRSCGLQTASAVCGVEPQRLLEIVQGFRDENEGHTFLMPPETRNEALLKGNEELDIAHEALLRRWRRLHDWVLEEARNADEFRWLASKASRGTGPLPTGELLRVLKWRRDFAPTEEWARRYERPLALAEEAPSYEFHNAMRYLNVSRNWAWLRLGVFTLIAIFAILISSWNITVDSLIREVADPITRLITVRHGYQLPPWPLERAKQALWAAYARPRPSFWVLATPVEPVSALSVSGDDEVAFAAGSRLWIWDDEEDHIYQSECNPPGCIDFHDAIRSVAYGEVGKQEVIAVGGKTAITLVYPAKKENSSRAFPGFSRWYHSHRAESRRKPVSGLRFRRRVSAVFWCPSL